MEEAERATDREKKGLLEIRRKRSWMWILFLSYLPAVYVFSLFTQAENAIVVFAASWMAVFIAAAIRAGFSCCPRCHKYFYMNMRIFFANAWARRCLNCGLRLVQEE